jgi:kallikrein
MKRQLVNDIALLVLKKDVNLAPNVALICLPNSNAKMDGKRCYATGWGKDDFGISI